MKRSISILAVLLLAASFTVGAQAQPTIGLFDDPSGVNCDGDIAPFENVTVYVVAILADIDEITAAEFHIDRIPEPGDFGLRTDNWATPLVIGSVEYGIALAFNPPQPGPTVLLGSLDFFMIDDSWVGSNHCMDVEPSLDSDQLVLVDGNYEAVDAFGYVYTFNTTGDYLCWMCIDITPTEKSSFSTLKSLY